ncbi:MAG: hypothetical protein P8N63_07095, partial [Pseudomonadales bacterium]|nr:hypothetical protein [Pseudomonadales bacterium]
PKAQRTIRNSADNALDQIWFHHANHGCGIAKAFSLQAYGLSFMPYLLCLIFYNLSLIPYPLFLIAYPYALPLNLA